MKIHDALGLPKRDVIEMYRWRHIHIGHELGETHPPREREIDYILELLRMHPWHPDREHGRTLYMVTDGNACIGAICYTRINWYDTASFWSNPAMTGVGRRLLRVIHDRVLMHGELHVHIIPSQVKALHLMRTYPYSIEEETNAPNLPHVRFRVVREGTGLLPFLQE